jgi:hypothetical protein
MANFARMENGTMVEVLVVNDDVLLNSDGVESEAVGIAFLKETFGAETEWVQIKETA